MATINLRPWREERAEERKKNFVMNLLGTALLAGLIVFAVGYYFDVMKDRQNDRNGYLKAETAKLDRDLAAIKELKEKRAKLLERLTAIQELQGSRPLIVRNFDELVRVMPDGLYYSSLSRKANRVAIAGLAQDNLDVSTLMRNLDTSIWFGEPNLSGVGKGKGNLNTFNLSVPVAKPKADEAGK